MISSSSSAPKPRPDHGRPPSTRRISDEEEDGSEQQQQQQQSSDLVFLRIPKIYADMAHSGQSDFISVPSSSIRSEYQTSFL